MKLFVRSKITGDKIPLNGNAKVRNDLRIRFSGEWFVFTGIGDDNSYHINEVFAEKELYKPGGLAVIGGFVGAIAGPPGSWAGIAIGGIAGNRKENKMTEAFNNSK